PAALQPALHAVEEALEVLLADGPHVRDLHKSLFHEVAALPADQETPALAAVDKVEGTLIVRRVKARYDRACVLALHQRRYAPVAQPCSGVAAKGSIVAEASVGFFRCRISPQSN